jgi:hypothetical protein
MIKIDYPTYQPDIKNKDGKGKIFDKVRKKWVSLTPEEWVRQNFLQYLIHVKKIPSSLIAVEREIQLGDLKKRFDILIFNNKAQPQILIECKANDILLDQSVLDQILRYNISTPVPFLIITNGDYTFGFNKENEQLTELQEFPDLF